PETASDSTTKIEIENGLTQPIYSTDDAIIEDLYVQTDVDSDNDGKRDRVSIQVMRPNTDSGVKVPVIYEMSPYRSGLNNVPNHDVDVELQPTIQQNTKRGLKTKMDSKAKNLGSLGNYYVPRGYAVILGESIGSGKSDRSEEHTSELQSRFDLVCRLLRDTVTTESYTLSLHDALPIFK